MRKKLLLLIPVFGFISFLLCQACKDARLPEDKAIKYSILGEWQATTLYPNGEAHRVICTFTGSKQNGTVTTDNGGSGTYTVGGQAGITAKWSFIYYKNGLKFTEGYEGEFIDENTISGLLYLDQEQQTYEDHVAHANIPDGGLLFQAIRR